MVKDPIRRHEDAVGDAALLQRTGRRRHEWHDLLDDAGAMQWPHARIARWLADEHDVDGWWAQGLTVGYEQARGLRLPGQRPDGTFEAGVSVTLPLPAAAATAWCTDPDLVTRWLDVVPEVRGATEGTSVRWTWTDGSRVHVGLTALPDSSSGPRCRLAVTHRGLASADAVPAIKAAWSERLQRLRAEVAQDGAPD